MTKAAGALIVSQPAVTQQIRRLEQELGVPLLDRGEDGLVMTEAGRSFQRFAERTLEHYDELWRELRSQRWRLRGTLRLGASTIPGEFVVPQILARFKELHPDVQASVAIADTAEVVSRLLKREFQVAFVGAEVKVADLVTSRLIDDEIILIVHPEHPFAQRRSIDFEDLSGQPLILRESGSGTMRSLSQGLSERGLELPTDAAVILGSSRAIISAVASGLGIGFVSALAVADRAPTVVPVAIKGLKVKRSLYYLHRGQDDLGELHQRFIDYLGCWAAAASTQAEGSDIVDANVVALTEAWSDQ